MKRLMWMLLLCVLVFNLDARGMTPYRKAARELRCVERQTLRELRSDYVRRVLMYRRTSVVRSESDWVVQHVRYAYRTKRASVILWYGRMIQLALRGAPLKDAETLPELTARLPL